MNAFFVMDRKEFLALMQWWIKGRRHWYTTPHLDQIFFILLRSIHTSVNVCMCVSVCVKLQHYVYGTLRQEPILCVWRKLSTKSHIVNGPSGFKTFHKLYNGDAPPERTPGSALAMARITHFHQISKLRIYFLINLLLIKCRNYIRLRNSTVKTGGVWVVPILPSVTMKWRTETDPSWPEIHRHKLVYLK